LPARIPAILPKPKTGRCSIGKESGTGIVLIGMGEVGCAALRRSRLGTCMVIER
jgi:hypothetical protein